MKYWNKVQKKVLTITTRCLIYEGVIVIDVDHDLWAIYETEAATCLLL